MSFLKMHFTACLAWYCFQTYQHYWATILPRLKHSSQFLYRYMYPSCSVRCPLKQVSFYSCNMSLTLEWNWSKWSLCYLLSVYWGDLMANYWKGCATWNVLPLRLKKTSRSHNFVKTSCINLWRCQLELDNLWCSQWLQSCPHYSFPF